jgi:DNA-binding transcriptional ArsR family regulator
MPSDDAKSPSPVDVARALAHPLRHRMLLEFHRSPSSPSQVARTLDAPLNVVSYHTKELCRRGCIELVDSRRVRGATERFYRSTVEPILDDDDWAALPARLRRELTQRALAMIWSDVRRAGMLGGFDTARSHLSRTPLELDAQGCEELNRLLSDVLDRAIAVEAESAARGGGDSQPAELVMLHFTRPPAASAP